MKLVSADNEKSDRLSNLVGSTETDAEKNGEGNGEENAKENGEGNAK